MSQATFDVSTILAHAGKQRAAANRRLDEILRIRTISTQPESAGEVRRGAEWVAAQLREIGFENVRIIELGEGHHPAVYGDWLHANGQPTGLIYGHYDVQPVNESEWLTPPFEPTPFEEGGTTKVRARGANDNKGQFSAILEALRAMIETNQGLPINLKILFEGEEEIGSPGFCAFVENPANAALLAADFALVADTDMAAETCGAITTKLRGLAYFDVEAFGAKDEVHSGLWGGAVPNPLTALIQLFAAVMDGETGRILIPGFYDGIMPLTPGELAALLATPLDQAAALAIFGLTSFWDRPGISVNEATCALPTFEPHGMLSGFTKPGQRKTSIPNSASGKCSFRLVAGQDPQRIIKLFTEFLHARCPAGITLKVTPLGDGVRAVGVDPNSRFISLAMQALSDEFGNPAVYRVSGGTIGAVSALSGSLNLPCVMMGLGLPGDGIHGKNESFSYDRFHGGTRVIIRYLCALRR